MDDVNETFNNSDEIQICNSVSEINNKIEHYLKRKRKECDDNNASLYCSSEHYFGSSRTHTTIVAKRRKKSESSVINSKNNNLLGPPCSGGLNSVSDKRYKLSNNTSSVGIKPDIQERISNLETCLNIKNNDHNNYNIYEKLKSIEDHVLKLENKLLNNGYYSLSHAFSNDGNAEIINHNLKTNYCSQEALVPIDSTMNEVIKSDVYDVLPMKSISNHEQRFTEDNISNKVLKLQASKSLPTNTRYTAEEIQILINKIKSIDENN